jgi:hypothetical protein
VDVFRRFFEQIVQQCQEAGLVWGKELYFDGTKVAANAGKESLTPRFAVEAHLLNLFGAVVEEGGANAEQSNLVEQPGEGQAGKQEMLPAPVPLPTSLSQEEREQLARQNAQRHDWMGREERRIAVSRVTTISARLITL